MRRVVLLLLVSSLLLSSCSLFVDENNKNSNGVSFEPAIDFRECGINQCALFEVPMNHEEPNGRKIEIKVVKIPARNQQQKLGSIFVNPGGPGASGVEFIEQNGSFIFGTEVLNKFDIISWDPRGVGGSSRVTCGNNLDPLFESVDYSPQTEEEKQKLIRAAKWIGQQCAQDDEELLGYLDTESTVLDLEALRVAIEEEKLNYLGYSYGTIIGQLYANKYPQHIRTMVLDGVADVTIDPIKLVKDQAIGFESALDSFFQYCRRQGCEFNQNRNPKDVYLELMNEVRNNPVPSLTDTSLSLGPAQFDIGTAEYLYYGEVGWRTLDEGLRNLRNNNNPTIMLDGFSRYVGRSSNGYYNGKYISFISIGCADGAVGNEERIFEIADEVKDQAPVFGQSGVLLGLQCSYWPSYDGNEAKATDLDIDSENTIVLIGTTGDPATPIGWARNVADKIENSVLIEKVGEGHTIYGRGDLCVDDAINNYFLTTRAPEPITC